MKRILFTLLIAAFLSIACAGQTSNDESSNWGAPVLGVQMSISMTNTEILVGSGLELACCITNSSANLVSIQTTGQPEYDFSVSLIDSSGKSRALAPNDNGIPRAIYMNLLVGINPGEGRRWKIPINLGSAVPTGSYKIEVSVPIYVLKQQYTLSSNLLKVEIK